MGVIQLDRRGRIVEANDHARDLLRRGEGLVDRKGFLHALLPAEDEKLQKFLAGALSPFGGQGVSGSLVVTCPPLSSGLVLHVSPVSEGRSDSRSRRVAVTRVAGRPVEPGNGGSGPGGDHARPYCGGEPSGGIAGARYDHPRHCGRDGTERDHHQVACQKYLRQTRSLPASGVGATGDVARSCPGIAALRPPAVVCRE